MLDCSTNNLSALDVTNLSSVELIVCWENNIGAIDISNCTVLEAFFCNDNNLSALDVTANASLKYLRFEDNNIPLIDSTNNTLLEILKCSNNLLSSLDLTNNLELNTLECASNNLTELDVSGNPLIYVVRCQDNSLTCLNVSNGNNLGMYDGGFDCTGNSDLNCIEVDDPSHSEVSWFSIPPFAEYSINCENSCSSEGSLITPELSNNLQLYPNPVKNSFQLESYLMIESVRITDLNGKEIMFFQAQNIYSLENLLPGSYIVQINTPNSRVYKRVLKV